MTVKQRTQACALAIKKMMLHNADFIQKLAKEQYFTAKMVFNQNGAIFFPVSKRHSDMKAEGISYEDNYKGTALAAILAPGRIEIRYHKDFTDGRVATVIGSLLSDEALAFMSSWQITYQGREISAGR